MMHHSRCSEVPHVEQLCQCAYSSHCTNCSSPLMTSASRPARHRPQPAGLPRRRPRVPAPRPRRRRSPTRCPPSTTCQRRRRQRPQRARHRRRLKTAPPLRRQLRLAALLRPPLAAHPAARPRLHQPAPPARLPPHRGTRPVALLQPHQAPHRRLHQGPLRALQEGRQCRTSAAHLRRQLDRPAPQTPY